MLIHIVNFGAPMTDRNRQLDNPDRLFHFLNALRDARQRVLGDSESAESVIFVLEKLGSYLTGEFAGLASYRARLADLAGASAYKAKLPSRWPALHISFNRIYDSVVQARNDAMHQGAYARHLAKHGVEVVLILEDAIMANATKAEEIMVPNPVTAESWQPVSHVRMTMLRESFSHLPILWENEWFCVSDYQIACYLRRQGVNLPRSERLCMSVADAVRGNCLELTKPVIAKTGKLISELASSLQHSPALVVQESGVHSTPQRLLGIITAFDLL